MTAPASDVVEVVVALRGWAARLATTPEGGARMLSPAEVADLRITVDRALALVREVGR